MPRLSGHALDRILDRWVELEERTRASVPNALSDWVATVESKVGRCPVRILPLDPNAITGHGKPLNPLVVYLRLKVWKQDLGNAIRILLPYARMEAQIDLGRAKADNINELLSSARWFRAGFAGRTVTAGSLLATVRAVRARTLASLRYLESDQCPEMAMARDWLADALYRCAADDPTFLAVALKMSVSPPLSWYTEGGAAVTCDVNAARWRFLELAAADYLSGVGDAGAEG